MNTKTAAAIAAIFVLLIAFGSLTYIRSLSDHSPDVPATKGVVTSLETTATDKKPTTTPPASDPVSSNSSTTEAEIIERYGKHRVRLSRRISSRIVTLNQRIAETGENAKTHIISLMERDPSELNPSDFDFPESYDEVARPSPEDLERLEQKPLPLQEMLLAGDARARGVLSESEYLSVLAITSKYVPETMVGIDTKNTTSLEKAEKHVEKLIKALD
ncbi:MAG: hypothetical protein ABJQ29_03935 [Luteolibacter sp.]